MAVDGIGIGSGVNTTDIYAGRTKSASEAVSSENAAKKAEDNGTGVVYEKSADAENKAASVKVKTVDHEAIVAKMKQDAEEQTAQLRSIVEKLMLGQGKASSIAGAKEGENTLTNEEDMWKFLAKGDFTVDAATKAQAQADIAEDGYWGVKQTSERILDFAKALAGDDPDKLEKMRDAFQKGFAQAEKTWGGKLPDISQQTYGAVMKGFDELTGKTVTE